MIFLLLCLIYFTQDDNFQVHPCCCIISLFLMAGQYSIVYRYYIFLTHPYVDGHWGGFHVLATVKWTLVWCIYPYGWCFPLDMCPGVGLQGRMVVLFLIFFRTLHTVLPSGCTNLHSRQQHRRVPFPLRVFLMIGMRMNVLSKYHSILWFPFSEVVISS